VNGLCFGVGNSAILFCSFQMLLRSCEEHTSDVRGEDCMCELKLPCIAVCATEVDLEQRSNSRFDTCTYLQQRVRLSVATRN
jgi:hypothetical protein